MNNFILEIHTIEKTTYKDQATRITLPTIDGQITVLANHLPVITALAPGEMTYDDYKGLHCVFISGGFAEIQGRRIIILANLVENPEDLQEHIVEKEIEIARKRAEELKKNGAENKAIESASVDLMLATSKLRFIRRRRHI